MNIDSRYYRKPMLRLLECYVLWSIGKLDPKEEESLTEMEPKLRQALHQEGDWRQIVAGAMNLPPDMPEVIRENWLQNLEIAAQNSVTLEPQRFAEMFVDDNLIR